MRVATLMNNLFGRSKEPFWQQAYTDLLKFVISLRRITDGYTTLAEVYRYIIDDKLIDKNIQRCRRGSRIPATCWSSRRSNTRYVRRRPGRSGSVRRRPHGAPVQHRPRNLPGRTRPALRRPPRDAVIEEDRRHRLDAIKRWFTGPWARLDRRSRRRSSKASSCSCRCSTRTRRCTARSVRHARPTQATGPRRAAAAAAVEDLLESGHVLGLNFPVALNPALARGLGRDAEARLPARRPESHSADGGAGAVVARPAVRLRRVPRLRHGRRDGPDRRRAGLRAVAAGAAHSDRRDPEPRVPCGRRWGATTGGARCCSAFGPSCSWRPATS